MPLALKAGVKLYCHCQATRFLYSGSHATTVTAIFKDPHSQEKIGTLDINARVIILACGTFYTPVLLMRSHVPNPSGMIGHNLTLHPAGQVIAMFDHEIKAWDEIPQGWYVDALKDEGIMFEGIFLPPPYTASKILHIGEKHREIMENYNRLAGFGVMVSDTSHGRIIRMPAGRALTIYNLNRTDVNRFMKGFEIVVEAFFAAGAKKVFMPLHNMPELTREDGTKPLRSKRFRAKDLDLQAFHPLGTCRMGANPKEAVCDMNGRFYGLDNVFIADGSIFPTSLGVNPMLTIMAAAAKIGDYVNREVL
jgi:choline dehydrogenase-like flavoprotein